MRNFNTNQHQPPTVIQMDDDAMETQLPVAYYMSEKMCYTFSEVKRALPEKDQLFDTFNQRFRIFYSCST